MVIQKSQRQVLCRFVSEIHYARCLDVKLLLLLLLLVVVVVGWLLNVSATC